MPKTDDRMIVKRVLAGEKNAFEELVERYRGMVYGLALSRLRDEEEARDITQEVFLEAYMSLGRLRDASKFSSWLYGIAMNLCRMWVRRESVRDEIVWMEEIPEVRGNVFTESYPIKGAKMPSEEYEEKTLKEAIWEAIDTLPEELREVVVLYYMDGVSYREIGEMLGVPESTIRGRLEAGRKKLREEMMRMVRERLRRGMPGEELGQWIVDQIVRSAFKAGGERRLEEAIRMYQDALALDPEYAIPYFCLGHAYLTKGDWEEGMKMLERFFELVSSEYLCYRRYEPYWELIREIHRPSGADRVDISEIVREALDVVRSAYDAYRVSVEMELAEDLPELRGDRQNLRRMCIYLIENAFDMVTGNYTKECHWPVEDREGRITLVTRSCEEDRIRFECRDNGPGLPKPVSMEKFLEGLRRKAKEKGISIGQAKRRTAPVAISLEEWKGCIFMPSWSWKMTRGVEPIENGPGLGLYFAGQIVRKHGGRIWVEDYAPEGATFIVELPT